MKNKSFRADAIGSYFRLEWLPLLFVTLWKYELASKSTTFKLRALKRKLAGEDEVWVGNPRRSAAPTL